MTQPGCYKHESKVTNNYLHPLSKLQHRYFLLHGDPANFNRRLKFIYCFYEYLCSEYPQGLPQKAAGQNKFKNKEAPCLGRHILAISGS
ncbi:hypothetical protein NPIL_396161 [Nephila pilipes]|uniref:Uncharacterized protein n=1 Tax=Nephila pilipes TaxID=299642 RepID=A0A8X6J3U2_NEPPI|nr:hypothetical protein NPIL_396161 [Nephila pilipes]